MAQKQTKKMLEKEEIVEEEGFSEVEEAALEEATLEEQEEVREEKKENKKKEKKKEKKNKKESSTKGDGYFKSLNKELKKVVWPKGGEVLKSTIAVIVICLVLIGFFELTQLLVAFVKGLFV